MTKWKYSKEEILTRAEIVAADAEVPEGEAEMLCVVTGAAYADLRGFEKECPILDLCVIGR